MDLEAAIEAESFHTEPHIIERGLGLQLRHRDPEPFQKIDRLPLFRRSLISCDPNGRTNLVLFPASP